jgi:hypothetical protein
VVGGKREVEKGQIPNDSFVQVVRDMYGAHARPQARVVGRVLGGSKRRGERALVVNEVVIVRVDVHMRTQPLDFLAFPLRRPGLTEGVRRKLCSA